METKDCARANKSLNSIKNLNKINKKWKGIKKKEANISASAVGLELGFPA